MRMRVTTCLDKNFYNNYHGKLCDQRGTACDYKQLNKLTRVPHFSASFNFLYNFQTAERSYGNVYTTTSTCDPTDSGM